MRLSLVSEPKRQRLSDKVRWNKLPLLEFESGDHCITRDTIYLTIVRVRTTLLDRAVTYASYKAPGCSGIRSELNC